MINEYINSVYQTENLRGSESRPMYNTVEFIDPSIFSVSDGIVEFEVLNHRISVNLLPSEDLSLRGDWLYDVQNDSIMADGSENDWNIAAADARGYDRQIMISVALDIRRKLIEELNRFRNENPVVDGLCNAWEWVVKEYDCSEHTNMFKKVLLWGMLGVEEITDNDQITQFLKKINEMYHLIEDLVGLRTDGKNVSDRVKCTRLETSYLLMLAAELRRVAASVFENEIQSNNPRVIKRMITHEYMLNVIKDAAGGSFTANGESYVMCLDIEGNTIWQI